MRQYISALNVVRTYAGCMEGIPSQASIFEGAKENALKIFGKQQYIVILDVPDKECSIHLLSSRTCDRKTNSCMVNHELLPQWQFSALISCYDGTSKSKSADGSWLVVIWYDDKFEFSIDHIVEQLDWNNQAQDFEY